MNIYRLDIDALEVDSFEPVAPPQTSAAEPVGNGIVWTGCMSECTECGMMFPGF